MRVAHSEYLLLRESVPRRVHIPVCITSKTILHRRVMTGVRYTDRASGNTFCIFSHLPYQFHQLSRASSADLKVQDEQNALRSLTPLPLSPSDCGCEVACTLFSITPGPVGFPFRYDSFGTAPCHPLIADGVSLFPNNAKELGALAGLLCLQ